MYARYTITSKPYPDLEIIDTNLKINAVFSQNATPMDFVSLREYIASIEDWQAKKVETVYVNAKLFTPARASALSFYWNEKDVIMQLAYHLAGIFPSRCSLFPVMQLEIETALCHQSNEVYVEKNARIHEDDRFEALMEYSKSVDLYTQI